MANQIVVSAGAKVRNLDGVLTGTSGVVNSLPINASNGIPQLDVNGKILVSQLPNSVMEYQGVWNANTNTPTLVNGTGNQGDVYLCNVAGTVDFGAGPIAFVVGDQVIYSGSIWQRASGATGTVTSVAITESGDSLNITGSPITTSGTINIGFNGTNLQYVNGAGNLTTFPTLITSIGLSMPSAFSVANSPLTANGTIAVTGAGYASQYIRGDGTLADFPSSGGGGSSVSYYLNGGTSQGTIGGTTYYEMSKTADTGTGVDFAKSGDGFIVAFLTDANDPAQLNIPAGNWNYEIYASMSANGGTPQMYAELYKYDGTTFTLISTSTNEILYDGTNLNLYTFGMTVPATTLALTDRLAIKLYATNSGGKTTTVHTQDSHLCQVITTFSTGITALNGLTAQVQYFATGTSGTDFNISSTTATHTFNIPSASATNRGLITTGSQTIAGSKTFNATLYGTDSEFSGSVLSPIFSVLNGTKVVNLQSLATLNRDIYLPDASGTIALTSDIPSLAGYVTLATTQTITGAKTFSGAVTLTSSVTTNNLTFANSGFFLTLQPPTLSVNRTVTLPDATGTLALTSDLTPYALNSEVVKLTGNQTIAGLKTFSVYTTHEQGALIKHGINLLQAGYTGIGASTLGLVIGLAGGGLASLNFNNTTSYTYTFPNATGTIALTSDLTGGTVTSVAALTIGTSGTDLSSSVANSTTTPVITLNVPTASATNRGALASADWTTFNNKQSALTIGNITSGNTAFLTLTGGTGAIIGSGVNINIIPSGIVGSGLTLTTTGTSGAATFNGATATLNIPTYTISGLGGLPLTGGTLTGALTGTSATFSGTITSGSITANSGGRTLTFDNITNYGQSLIINAAGSLPLILQNNGVASLTLTSSGAATFSSSVTAGGNITSGGSVIIPSFETATNVLSFRAGIPEGYNVGIRAKAITTANRDGLELLGYNGIDFSIANGATVAMRITSGGNVLIGSTDDGSGSKVLSYSTSAASQFKAAGTAPAITFTNTITGASYGGVLGACTSANQFISGTSAGDMVLANQFSGYRLYAVSYSGGVYLSSGATSWTANSDIRLKNINGYIENAVEKLSTLQTINFSYKDDKTNKQNLGLIAQEVEKIFPELIDKNGDGMLGVRYTELVPVLIKAVQELKLEIETLKNK